MLVASGDVVGPAVTVTRLIDDEITTDVEDLDETGRDA